jgi:hypothetical protein
MARLPRRYSIQSQVCPISILTSETPSPLCRMRRTSSALFARPTSVKPSRISRWTRGVDAMRLNVGMSGTGPYSAPDVPRRVATL